jgi:FkbM family methyltransferase
MLIPVTHNYKYSINRYILSIKDLLPISDSWIVYGNGVTGKSVASKIQKHVKYIIDSHSESDSKCAIPIVNIDDANFKDETAPVLICTHNAVWIDEITTNLLRRGVSNFFIYSSSMVPLDDKNTFLNKKSRVLEIFKTSLDRKIYDDLATALEYGQPTENTLTNYLLYSERQYLDLVGWDGDALVVEGGVFDGATAAQILNLMPGNRVIGIDPIYKKERSYITSNASFEHICCALWSENTQLSFSENGAGSYATTEVKDGNINISAKKLDTIFKNFPDRITHLKLDIEGAEMEALKGGIGTIKKNRPFLMISIYHSSSDFFEIPLFLAEHLNEYSWHIRNYSAGMIDTILYGIPK